MSDHTIVLSGSWRSFLYSSSVCSCHLFLVSSASVRSIPFLSFIVFIFAWSVPLVSDFLEEISSLSYSFVFLYFFALITEEGFLISPCYSLELCIQIAISFLFSFAFSVSSFLSYLLRPPQMTFLPFFFLRMVLITKQISQPGDLAKGLRIPGNLTLEAVGFAYRIYTALGKQTLGGHKQNLVHQDPGERSRDPTRDWPKLSCECPGVSGGGVGWQWPAAGSRALSAAVCAQDLLKEVAIFLHYLHRSLGSSQTVGRECSPAH